MGGGQGEATPIYHNHVEKPLQKPPAVPSPGPQQHLHHSRDPHKQQSTATQPKPFRRRSQQEGGDAKLESLGWKVVGLSSDSAWNQSGGFGQDPS